jgi:hypothetical protein
MPVRMYWVGWKVGLTVSEVSRLDLWIVQLDDLIRHALEIRDTNVMKYKRNAKKSFEMGINMMVLLMKNMIEDMVAEKKGE